MSLPLSADRRAKTCIHMFHCDGIGPSACPEILPRNALTHLGLENGPTLEAHRGTTSPFLYVLAPKRLRPALLSSCSLAKSSREVRAARVDKVKARMRPQKRIFRIFIF